MPEFRAPLSLDLILNILSVLDGFLVHTQLPACLLAYLGYIELSKFTIELWTISQLLLGSPKNNLSIMIQDWDGLFSL